MWEQQIKKFDNAYTISYDSFKTHKFYLNSKIRDEKITKLKSIELVENTNIKKKFTEEMKGNVSLVQRKKINFNTWEKIYFFIKRKLESKKVNRKNY